MLMGEIYDFLVANRFELEMNHAVSRRTLQLPTQKEFVLMFQFLYRKIDPHFTFTKSLETDVVLVLRAWEYPYTEQLSRTHIGSVGQSWPKFLAMLYWLMKLNLALLGLTEDDMIASDDPFDRLFIRYTHQCYGAYIDQKEDYSSYYKDLENEFDEINSKTAEDQEERRRRLNELLQKRDELRAKVAELSEAQAKSRALENDLQQFSDYMNKMNDRKEQWGELLLQMEAEYAKLQQQVQDLLEEKKKYEDELIGKGLSAQDIDQLYNERDRLSKAIERSTNKLKDIQQSIADQEYQLGLSTDSLLNLVSQYNYLTSRIPVQEYLFELAVNPNLTQSEQEITADNVLTKKLRDEKVKLLQCRSALTQELRKKQEEKLKLQEEVDQLHVKIFELNEFLDGVKAKCRKTMQLYSEAYDFMMTDSKTYSAKIEKLDRDLQTLRLRVNTGIIEAESTIKSLRVKKQETEYRIKEERENLHRVVLTVIDQVLDFKYTIQEGLEELDTLAFQELEAQED